MKKNRKVKVLFVCMGNICRSPTAHGVFRKLVEDNALTQQIEIDSAGTHAYHVGNPPDGRAQETAISRGIRLDDLRARQVNAGDMRAFDYIIAMDDDNYRILHDLCPREFRDKLYLLMQFAPELGAKEVPDPYYGGALGFEQVFDMVEAASAGLLEEIKASLHQS